MSNLFSKFQTGTSDRQGDAHHAQWEHAFRKGREHFACRQGRSSPEGAGATFGAQYSRIVVEDGAQFDMNGRTYHDYDYTLAGSGPDGTGALISTAEMDAATAYAQNEGTAFLRNVTLAADATVYAGGNMGMIFYNHGANTMTMGGYTVTYDGVEAVDDEGNGTGIGAYRTFLGNMSYLGEGKIVVATNGWVQTHTTSPSATNCNVEVIRAERHLRKQRRISQAPDRAAGRHRPQGHNA